MHAYGLIGYVDEESYMSYIMMHACMPFNKEHLSALARFRCGLVYTTCAPSGSV
jgi:hypothetical protein